MGGQDGNYTGGQRRGLRFAQGGLALAEEDKAPRYQLDAIEREKSVQRPTLSFAQLDPFATSIGSSPTPWQHLAEGGSPENPYASFLRSLTKTSGGGGGISAPRATAGTMTIGGPSDLDTGMGDFGSQPSDPKFAAMDPRSRAIAAMNERHKRSASLSASEDAITSIMGRMLNPNQLTLSQLAPVNMSFPGYSHRRAFAEGGEVDSSAIASIGAGAAPFLRARHLNSIARPFSRAWSKPVLGMEAVSKHPLSRNVSDARYNHARDSSMHEYKDLPVHRGQGAWEGENGMEFNPLYMQEMPRSMGRLKDDTHGLRYASQMGENLEQVATPVSRFVPNMINTPDGANAMMFSGIDDERLRALAESAGSGWVTAHRPGNKAMMFPLNDEWSLDGMANKLRSNVPGSKVRYGRSDADVDRVLLAREPLGYESGLYEDFGARPRTEAYDTFERALLSNQRARSGDPLLNRIGRGAK